MPYFSYSSLKQQVPSAWPLRLLGIVASALSFPQFGIVTIVLIVLAVFIQGLGYHEVLNDKNSGDAYFWCSEIFLLFVIGAMFWLFGQRTTSEQQKAKQEKEAADALRQASVNRPVSAAKQDGNNVKSWTGGEKTDHSDPAVGSAAATSRPSSSASACANRPASLANQDAPVNISKAEDIGLSHLNSDGTSAVGNPRFSSDASTSYSAESSRKGKQRQTSPDDDQVRQKFYGEDIESQLCHDEDKERQTPHDEDQVRQTFDDVDKERQTFVSRLKDALKSRRQVLLDAAFQLALCWLVLTSILLAYNKSWWSTLHQIQYQVTYDSAPRLRTPGVMFLTSSEDPFQTNLENATQPPVCGFRNYYDKVSTVCPWNGTNLIEDPEMCNCTSNIRHNNTLTNYTATAVDPLNMTYFLYHFAPPIQVTKTSLNTVYYVWPDLSQQQINVNFSEPLSPANCSRSRINVVFYDPESTDAKNENWNKILAAEENPMHPLPAGSVIHVQVQRNTFKNVTDPSPRVSFAASWGPPMQTGDCSVLFSVSYATMQQKNTVAVPVKGVSDYVGQLGGFLSLIQAVATIFLWMVVLSSDLWPLRRHFVNTATATGA